VSQSVWVIEQFRGSFSFGAEITAAGRAVRIARNLNHPAPFQVNKHLADPMATAACRTYYAHLFGHQTSPSCMILRLTKIIIQASMTSYQS
jgi:hypothetical protein